MKNINLENNHYKIIIIYNTKIFVIIYLHSFYMNHILQIYLTVKSIEIYFREIKLLHYIRFSGHKQLNYNIIK